MTRKYLSVCLFLLAALMAPGLSFAASPPEKEGKSLLSAFVSYTDLRIASVQKTLEVIASTKEARGGSWDEMKSLLGEYQRLEDGLIVWYVKPDGTYYTAEKGLIEEKLSDREYFPDLMAGKTVKGALVVSRSTGRRSAVIAVPMKDGDKVTGAVGASVFLDELSEKIGSVLDLQEDSAFFALAPGGLTTLHRKTDRHFLDPRVLGSETLKKAAEEMLSSDSGEVRYEFDNEQKKALYRTSPLTGWKFALTRGAKERK